MFYRRISKVVFDELAVEHAVYLLIACSLDQCLAANQVLEVLVSLLVFLLLFDRLGHDVSELGPIKEGARVLQDVVGPIVENLSDEESDEAHQLGVLAEVKLVLYAKFQLQAEHL